MKRVVTCTQSISLLVAVAISRRASVAAAGVLPPLGSLQSPYAALRPVMESFVLPNDQAPSTEMTAKESDMQQQRGRTMVRRRDMVRTTPLLDRDAMLKTRSMPPMSRTSLPIITSARGISSLPARTPTGSGSIIAYTDGSCIPQNGGSSIGVFFGDDHPLNVSKALNPPHNSGLAEITAAKSALRQIRKWSGYSNQSVIIRTDYMGVIDAMNNGSFGKFAAEYADLRRLAERFPNGVTFEHVYGHDGEHGNEMADQLARRALDLRARSASPTLGRRRSRSRSRSGTRRSRSAHVRGRSAPPAKGGTTTAPRSKTRHSSQAERRADTTSVPRSVITAQLSVKERQRSQSRADRSKKTVHRDRSKSRNEDRRSTRSRSSSAEENSCRGRR